MSKGVTENRHLHDDHFVVYTSFRPTISLEITADGIRHFTGAHNYYFS